MCRYIPGRRVFLHYARQVHRIAEHAVHLDGQGLVGARGSVGRDREADQVNTDFALRIFRRCHGDGGIVHTDNYLRQRNELSPGAGGIGGDRRRGLTKSRDFQIVRLSAERRVAGAHEAAVQCAHHISVGGAIGPGVIYDTGLRCQDLNTGNNG